MSPDNEGYFVIDESEEPGAWNMAARVHKSPGELAADLNAAGIPTSEYLELAECNYRQAVYDLQASIQQLNQAHAAHWLTQWQLQK